MATAKNYLRITHGEVIVKVAGTAAAETIDLQAELIPIGPKNYGAGTITSSSSSTAINGASAGFTAAWVGAKLYTSANVYIGAIATFNNGASLTLVADGAVTYDGAYYVAFPSQELDGDTQTVNITGATWTGANNGIITIARGGVTVMTLQANAAGQLDFAGQMMIPDPIANTSDIVVTISGAQAECWLKLRKVSGYKTHIEPEQFGSYDDPSVAGS